MPQTEISIEIEKLEAECKKLEELRNDAINLDFILKLMLNSVYGIFGQKYSPLFDTDHSSSITLTGQAVVKRAADIVYEYVKNLYPNKDIKKSDLYIYGDTDSCFFSFEKLDIPLFDDKGKLSPDANDFVYGITKKLNDDILEWAEKELCSTDPRFIFKRETICDVSLNLEKKRYILHIIDNDGVETNKFKYAGVEVARSTFSAEIKVLIKKVIEELMMSQDRSKATEIYRKGYAEFQQLTHKEVSFRSKISDYEKYYNQVIDNQIAKRTPVHVKSAIYYNRLLKQYGLDIKYEPIGSGQKIKWFYAGNNKYGMSSFAFIADFPKEIEDVVKVNYQKMFEKTVVPPLERIYTAIGWKLPDLIHEAQVDLFDLFK